MPDLLSESPLWAWLQHSEGCPSALMRRAVCKCGLDEALSASSVDGERWRALIQSARIRILGTGGSDDEATMHIGMEIWGAYHAVSEGVNNYAIKTLTLYADARRKAGLVK